MAVPLFDTADPARARCARARRRASPRVLDARHASSSARRSRPSRREFADYLGARHAIGVANGTDALTLALRALGVGPGDEVVVPSFTFYASRRGDPADRRARRCSATSTPRPSASRPRRVQRGADAAHEGGRRRAPVRQRRAGRARSRRSASRSSRTPRRPPARWRRRAAAGALGTVATFSFFPSKNLGAFGDGGAVTTDDDDVAERVRMLRFHGSRDKVDVRAGRLQLAPRRAAGRDPARAAAAPRRAGPTAAAPRRGARTREAGPRRARRPARARPTAREPAWHLYVIRHERADALAAALQGAPGSGQKAYYRVPAHRQPAMRDVRAAAPTCPAPTRPRARTWRSR